MPYGTAKESRVEHSWSSYNRKRFRGAATRVRTTIIFTPIFYFAVGQDRIPDWNRHLFKAHLDPKQFPLASPCTVVISKQPEQHDPTAVQNCTHTIPCKITIFLGSDSSTDQHHKPYLSIFNALARTQQIQFVMAKFLHYGATWAENLQLTGTRCCLLIDGEKENAYDLDET